MNRLYEEISFFLKQKFYVIFVFVTGILSYGFAITHASIGVDDTIVGLYLEEGLEVVMGRWTIFLLNRVFHMSEFTPFITEAAGLLLLFLAVTLFCVLVKRIFGERINCFGYTAFACVFVSCPFISEVWVYYYHDGVDFGYVMLALSLLCFMNTFERMGKDAVLSWIGSLTFAWIAVGCYESFIILYIYGCITVLFLRGIARKEDLSLKLIVQKLLCAAAVVVACVLLRTLMQQLIVVLFQLRDVEIYATSRDLTSVLALFESDAWLYDIFMLIKKYWAVYFVNGAVYLPVRIHVCAVIVIGIVAVAETIRRKNGNFLLLFLGMLLAPMLLTFVELKAPLYRACQYMPFLVAISVLLLYVKGKEFGKHRLKDGGRTIVAYAFGLGVTALVWNQSFEMNRNFYTDYCKYQYEKNVLTEVAGEIMKTYGTEKKIIFTGKFMPPYDLVKDYYAPYSSKEFATIAKLTDWLDVHLKEKFYEPYGYYFGGEAHYSLIDWGLYAFGFQGTEIINFLKMHGYEFHTVTDEALIEKAEKLTEDSPGWPREGSIIEMDEYVVVHF